MIYFHWENFIFYLLRLSNIINSYSDNYRWYRKTIYCVFGMAFALQFITALTENTHNNIMRNTFCHLQLCAWLNNRANNNLNLGLISLNLYKFEETEKRARWLKWLYRYIPISFFLDTCIILIKTERSCEFCTKFSLVSELFL